MPPTGTHSRLQTSSCLAAFVLASASALAQFSHTWDFEGGTLPSTDPAIEYYSTNGPSESSVFSVANGLLHQNSFQLDGYHAYYGGTGYASPTTTSLTPSPNLDLAFEAMLKVTNIGSLPGGVQIQARDGVYQYRLEFGATHFRTSTAGGPMNIPHGGIDIGQFHTYRVESAANSSTMTIYIDGAVLWSGPAGGASSSQRFFNWGDVDNEADKSADAQWEYVKIEQCAGLIQPQNYTGSGEDLVLATAVNAPTPIDSSTKIATAGDSVAIGFGSPGGTYDLEPYALVGQFFPTGCPPIGPVGFPEVHVDPGSAFVILPLPSPLVLALPATGINAAFVVPPATGLVGSSLILQAIAGSSISAVVPNNGFFAISDGCEIRFQ